MPYDKLSLSRSILGVLIFGLGIGGCALENQSGPENCQPPELVESCQADSALCEDLEDLPTCNNDRADAGSGIPGWWFERAGACYDEADYACVERYFHVLAWGGWLKGQKYASEALSKYLDCETEVLEVPSDEILINSSRNEYSDENVVSMDEALDTMRFAVEEELRTIDLEVGETTTIELTSILTASGNEDIRKTLGRFHLAAKADLIKDSVDGYVYTLHYEIEDEYDWHPNRIAKNSRASYSDLYPYHTWAAKLRELGKACNFPMHAAWDEEQAITK